MHQLQCKCGAVRGHIKEGSPHNRLICYCTDCRAFARFLAGAGDILDAAGGTEIIQLAQSRLHFVSGAEQLVALKLTEKGMVRWYTQCCHTAIGNTLASPAGAFIGLIHSCLHRQQLEADFGAKVALLNTNTALGPVQQRGLIEVLLRFLTIMISERLSGRYRQSPLFSSEGILRVTPKTLTKTELQQLKAAG